MALQSSGPISLSDIKTELGSSANDFRTLHAAAGFTTPDSISEFYGYSAATAYTFLGGDNLDGYSDWSQACGEAYRDFVLYSSSTTLGTNVELFTDNTLSTSFDGGVLWWKSGTYVYEIDSRGKVLGRRGC